MFEYDSLILLTVYNVMVVIVVSCFVRLLWMEERNEIAARRSSQKVYEPFSVAKEIDEIESVTYHILGVPVSIYSTESLIPNLAKYLKDTSK